jgi:hypothetical protein
MLGAAGGLILNCLTAAQLGRYPHIGVQGPKYGVKDNCLLEALSLDITVFVKMINNRAQDKRFDADKRRTTEYCIAILCSGAFVNTVSSLFNYGRSTLAACTFQVARKIRLWES